LDSHLSNDQIEELLLFSPRVLGESTSDREVHNEAQIHLKACESCQIRARAQEKSMERFNLLKSGTSAASNPQCPAAEALADLAAGMRKENATEILDHAMGCDHCGPILRQLVENFAEELTPWEEKQITALSSSKADWQTAMAGKLRDAQAFPPVASVPGSRWRPVLASMFSPMRLALATALIGLIVLGIRDYRRTLALSGLNRPSDANFHTPQQQLQQREATAESISKSGRSPVLVAAPPNPKAATEPQIAYLKLDTDITRGAGAMKRLAVPAGTDIVKITLDLAGKPEGVFHEELRTVDGRLRWSARLEPSPSEKQSKSLTIWLPAYLLHPDDYQILVNRESSSGIEEVASYVFRVIR
jgi:hypothetical protein